MAEDNHLSNVDLSCLKSPTFSTVSLTVYVIVCTATIFGNILILLSMYKYSNRFKGNLYMLIGNLAVADLLLGFWLLLFIYEEIVPEVQQIWFFCLAKPVGVFISYCCSTFTLLVISFDRFIAVMFPLKYIERTHTRMLYIVTLFTLWFISIVIGSLPVILNSIGPPQETFVCKIGAILPHDLELLPLGILGTVFIGFTLYGIILRRLRRKESTGNNARMKRASKTVMMIFVFVVFMVLWLPFIICSCLMQVDLAPSLFKNVVCAREYLMRLGLLNSALNWIIYGLTNDKFRMAFRNIICCK
ncbi:sphingosine 1-phosphate receptor 1-like [Mercenaria mercenaria]|uniref:sphingosine 1-phosphate receptor 1-like n=1 Tax=Mercenaria mercenaria TaxID=6596 RepID=UPI00234F60B9|nr:sphingosine 1-phosphate receptor 1-like [Mercenaria mercenaria]